MKFEKGHPKVGGRQKGTRDKKRVALDEAREKLALLGRLELTPEEVTALTPLAAMRLILAARIKAGDYDGALVAAEAAAPIAIRDLRVPRSGSATRQPA